MSAALCRNPSRDLLLGIVILVALYLAPTCQAIERSRVAGTLAGYMSNDDLRVYMQAYARRCSPVAKLHSLGTSVDGRCVVGVGWEGAAAKMPWLPGWLCPGGGKGSRACWEWHMDLDGGTTAPSPTHTCSWCIP